eukprot:15831299-Heterocapsa_arctica.AAC.1
MARGLWRRDANFYSRVGGPRLAPEQVMPAPPVDDEQNAAGERAQHKRYADQLANRLSHVAQRPPPNDGD